MIQQKFIGATIEKVMTKRLRYSTIRNEVFLKTHPKIYKPTQNEVQLYFGKIPTFIAKTNYWKYLCSEQVVNCVASTQSVKCHLSDKSFWAYIGSMEGLPSEQMIKKLQTNEYFTTVFLCTSRTVTGYSLSVAVSIWMQKSRENTITALEVIYNENH